MLDEMLFLGAGILISIATAAIVGITVWSFRSMVGPLSLVLAIEAGLVLLIIGLAFGGIMIGNESNTVGEAGALKIPHALGIHAAQLLPLLGIGLRFTRLSEAERVRVMIAGVVAYSAVVGATTYQALSGRALSDVSIGALVLVVVAMAACGLAAYRVWRGTTAEVASFERSAR